MSGGFKSTILYRWLRKAGEATDFSQEELLDWEKLPREVRRKMSAEDLAAWRRQRRGEPLA